MSRILIPCPGCGTLFPPYDGPTHRYIGASAACWALFTSFTCGSPDADLLAHSRPPQITTKSPTDTGALGAVLGDAYGVQHHGEDSPQAIQSVALHLLSLHGAIAHRADGLWVKERALRKHGVFHKLSPPTLGFALTIRHLFPSEGLDRVVTRSEYAQSVYDAWVALHRTTVESWYRSYVAA